FAAGGPRERDDGYASTLVAGIHASEAARRLARELAFSDARIALLLSAPPGAYAQAVELALEGELERAGTLCFLIAYLCPSEDEDPFGGISLAFEAVERGQLDTLDFDALALGPRSSHRAGAGGRVLRAYEAWAARAGSQQAAFAGDPGWTAERRFARLFERLSIHGLTRAARFDLLVSLGALGIYRLAADSLHLGAATGSAALPEERGGEAVLAAAKRAFGIGDPMILERRAADLAEATGVRLEALDLALFNWGGGARATLGADGLAPDAERAGAIAAALAV
ncbi:MAG: alpha-glutamyl/putrescinyl thymine pyrophosphorylase clade 3 protein, partial [Solirubrobacteraceae bacterium]